jgi:serine/threonine protein kinase/Flp pilus assembly protein TadD
MTPQTFQRVRDLFATARELPIERVEQWLVEACGSDAWLRDELRTLLARHREGGKDAGSGPGHPLDRPLEIPVDLAERSQELATATPAASPGQFIGDYGLIRQLGEGGMGVVYEAEQQHPRRLVALKLIRPFLVTRNLLRRFEHEADVLARLDHPGIARVYEAGTFQGAPGGAQPFFAMELVRGVPLNAYARDRKLDVRSRLELLAKVCDAVHHAHQKGVVHRDLKPSNILVDDSGQPKVLDFGVAKAVDGDVRTIAPSQTMHTESGQLVGTIPYMSPEQVAGDVRQIDTRSDVYALGVIGFELLAGRLPYAVLDKPLPEAARVIREDEPSRLSSVDRTFRGDVETIVGKALQKEKERRYGSAGELAADIARHLNYEPIAARAPGTWYQLSRFARRNKALTTGAALVFVALTVGVVTTSVQALRARRAERNTQEVNKLLNSVLVQASPYYQQGREITVREALDAAAKELLANPPEQPLVEALLRETLGSTYFELGRLEPAIGHLERALVLRRQHQGDDHADTARAGGLLAQGYRGTAQPQRALALARELLDRERRARGPDTEQAMSLQDELASALLALGEHAEAEREYREALDRRRRVLGNDHEDVVVSTNNLAMLLKEMGRFDEALSLMGRAVDAQKRLQGPDHPATLAMAGNLAVVLLELHRAGDAEPVLRDVLERRRRVLGNDHPDTLTALNVLGGMLNQAGRFDEAVPVLREAVNTARRVLGPDHGRTLFTINNLAMALLQRGDLELALPLTSELFEQRHSTKVSADNRARLATVHGMCLEKMRRYGDAEPALLEALRMLEETGQATTPRAQRVMRSLAEVCSQTSRPDEARGWRARVEALSATSSPATDRASSPTTRSP